MTNVLFWRYEFDYVLHASEVWVHEAGRMVRTWAGCKIFRFGPARENYFLLTSPFIEQISQIGTDLWCLDDAFLTGKPNY